MVESTSEQIIPGEVVGPRCGNPGQAVGFVCSPSLRSK